MIKIFVLGTRGIPDIQGGVETHCQELFPRIAKLGYNVTLIRRTPYIKNKIRKNYKSVNLIDIYAPRIKSLEAIIHTFLGILYARIKKPDILHIHAIGPSVLIPLARLLGLKVVMTNHGPDYNRQKWGSVARFILKKGERYGTKYANAVIVISNEIKRLVENKYKRSDFNLIYNGVNIPQETISDDYIRLLNLEKDRYVLAVARFVQEKGLHDLIDAYLKINLPEFKLVIVGDADHETEYSQNLKEKAKKIKGIILTGVITGGHLRALYSNAGLFVLPSYYEGLPIVLLEAMSHGLPVLVSDIPQNREIRLPDFRFFPPGDVNMLAEKMVELFKRGISEEERQEYRRLLEKDYNWDVIARKTIEVYRSVYGEQEVGDRWLTE